MADEPLREARFDHVNEHGELVFEAMNRHFTVRVTDSLERGIMEAKQVRAEQEGTPQPQAAAALPISQIQSMIRSGIAPVRIAAQFGVAEPLVRRFAAPVETEKKYAIDQFLSMRVNKGVRGSKSNADVIAESLQTSRIDMDSLDWQATRRGHEPWRIQATFESANRTLKADWSWNMRDNSVVSLNSIAKRLLGETGIPVPGLSNEPTDRDGSPFNWGDGASAAAAGPAYDAPAGVAGAVDAAASALGVSGADAGQAAGPANPTTAWMYGGAARQTAAGEQSSHNFPAAVSNGETAPVQPVAGQAAAVQGAPGAATPDAAQATPQPAAAQPDQAEAKPKRKTSRSAVPSWDEILFGE